jgi:hypothetical protein
VDNIACNANFVLTYLSASKASRALDILGKQLLVEVSSDPEVALEENSNGPHPPEVLSTWATCIMNGKSVPTVVTCSKIVLKHLGQHICSHQREATFFLLLNGHGRHFELLFHDYINTDATIWTICIGVLYSSNLWQVGDSVQSPKGDGILLCAIC